MQTCAGSHIVLSSIRCSWPVNLQVLACSETLGLDVVLGAADDEMTAPYPKSSCHVGSVALLLLLLLLAGRFCRCRRHELDCDIFELPGVLLAV